jgi:nucleoside-diphosphate-sugar epimerase
MYNGRRVLVTGGLGFIGSNLAVRLAREGARVSVVESMVAGCGANLTNISPSCDAARTLHFFRAQQVAADRPHAAPVSR